eukprot:TRINITY_DN116_c0_g2_i1.p1 TRINITY_DN116_c0_g2~~TRINITY_DN116_c0_g2_i1.p1  ORF type:complete len:204 (+),score=41.82 TRINITY_DN116_c0_g2_i1:69-614(+)
MKISATLSVAVLLLLAHAATAATDTLPDLYKITPHKFTALYTRGDFAFSVLFLTSNNAGYDAPDLVYFGTNSSCEFKSATSVIDQAFFTMLGPRVPLESLSADSVLRESAEWRFNTVPVYEGATYGLVENKQDMQSIVVFNVTSAGPCGSPVGITYSVLFFRYIEQSTRAPGFGWSKHPRA